MIALVGILGVFASAVLGYSFGAHEATLGAVASMLATVLVYGRSR